MQASAGNGFGCGLDNTQQLWCWGDNTHGVLVGLPPTSIAVATPATPGQSWDAVSAGGGHVCALASGALSCWGRNERGQVSLDVEGDIPAPMAITIAGGPAKWTTVATGFNDTCAIGDGRLFCWGAGDGGQLGTGRVDDSLPTEIIPAVTDWVAVSPGHGHSCASSTSMGLFCWGDNFRGDLGIGNEFVKESPQPVALPNVISLASAAASTCAVTSDGKLFCWGEAADGELGDPAIVDPTGGDRDAPVMASAMTGWTAVAAAESYTCAQRADELWCWGFALTGGIGNGVWASTKTMSMVASGITSFTVGWNEAFEDSGDDTGDLDLTCVTQSGAIQCWGDNRYGQLAQGGTTFALEPVAVAGDHVWTAIAAGASHACGLDGSGMFCWGSTQLGQITGLATGGAFPCSSPDTCDAAAPTLVANSAGTTAISLGANHTCALQGSSIACWGDNGKGQCGDTSPGAAPRTVPGTWSSLFASANGTCAASGATTQCWGQAITMHAPAHEASLDGALAIELGPNFGCALDATHTLACFGSNSGSEFGNNSTGSCGDGSCDHDETAASCAADCGPGPLTELGRSYTSIDVGDSSYACGVTTGGTVECWGQNDRGQADESDPDTGVADPVGTPFTIPDLTGCTQVTAGELHTCALCGGSAFCWGEDRHGEVSGSTSTLPVLAPRQVVAPAMETWSQLAAGDGFTCGLTTVGHAYCWGDNPHGALGNGAKAANLAVPIKLQ